MLRKFLSVFLLLLVPAIAHAGDKPIYAPAPDWVKAAPAPAIDGAAVGDSDPVVLLYDQQQRLLDGQVWSFFDRAVRVATPQQLTEAGTITLPWDPGKGDLTIHKIEIIRGAEHVDLIAGGARFNVIQREQKLEQYSLDGQLTATLAVEGLRVGDVLHASFSISRKDPALHGNLVTVAPLIVAPSPLKYGRVRLIWPKDSPLKWRTYLGGVTPQLADLPDGYRELTVTLPLPKPGEMPGDAPQRFQPQAMLEATTYPSWEAVSKDMAPLYATDGAIAAGSPLAAEVAKIAAASADPRQRAALALQLVQDKVRYLYRGMDNGNYVPQPPALTWDVRYGDCKAKTLLLLAILRKLGIEAEPALVNSQLGDMLSVRLPSPGGFDHVIVHATIAGKSLWLDGTDGGARLADLGDVPPFVNALPVRAAGSGLVPLVRGFGVRPQADVTVTVDSHLGVSLPALFTFDATFRGGLAEAMRSAQIGADRDKLAKVIDPMINSGVGTSSIFGRTIRYDEAAGTATLHAEGVTYPDWEEEDGRMRLGVDKTLDGIDFSPDRARAAWRDIPVAAGDYSDVRTVVHIRLPDGGKGFDLDGQTILPPSLAGRRLQRTALIDGDQMMLDDRIVEGAEEVAAGDVPAMRSQVAAAKAHALRLLAPKGYPNRLEQIVAAKKANAFAPLLAAYGKAIADDPGEALGYAARAWFDETTYDRAGAIADLSKAIEIAPDVDLYRRRAAAYVETRQDAKAVADLEAAIALDPSADGPVFQLADLRGELGKVDEAAAMLNERIDQGGKTRIQWQQALASVLADGGKLPEGLATIDAAIAASPGNASLLNSRCWLKATHDTALDTALKDCTKSIELSENPSAALDSRAMVYFRMNRFDDALVDLNAALDAAPEQAASLFMRGVIGKRTGAKTADADLAAARMIEPRIDERFGRWGIKP